MAEACVLVSQDQFSCPICLDLLKNPVAIPCGHSFCMNCITNCWDEEDRKEIYSCPQCRQTFIPRPVLGKNTILADMVEKLKQTGIYSDSPTPFYAGPGDVECDVCTGRKRKAVKSCLVCLSSYCETHFRVHNDLNPGKKHKVIDATGKLQDRICPHHDKLLEVFCRTEQTCICLLCVMDKHSRHKTVSAAAERAEKQKQLDETLRTSQQRISERERELQQLTQAVESLKSSAQAAVKDSERIFSEVICSIEKRRSEVTKLIRDQERAEVSRAEELMEKLEQEIAELKRRDAELEQLSHNDDHIHFLQSFQHLCSLNDPEDLSLNGVCSDVSFEQVKNNVSHLKDELNNVLSHGMNNITKRAKVIRISTPPEPLTREDLLTYSRELSPDPNTAHAKLKLSKTKITCKDLMQYPDHPQRFDFWQQVLCKDSLTGKCYWEVEWSQGGTWGVFIAVSYKQIGRKGDDDWVRFGYNNQSWSLSCSSSGCSFIHNQKETKLCVAPSTRIGVYVDHKAGTLTFYNISSNAVTLLHKVQTTFSQHLYPGFWLGTGSKIKFNIL